VKEIIEVKEIIPVTIYVHSTYWYLTLLSFLSPPLRIRKEKNGIKIARGIGVKERKKYIRIYIINTYIYYFFLFSFSFFHPLLLQTVLQSRTPLGFLRGSDFRDIALLA